MAKAKVKPKFRITKRFEIWVETAITSESLATALDFAQRASLSDFLVADHADSAVIDETVLPGTGVSEDF